MRLVGWLRRQFHIMSLSERQCKKFVDIGNAMVEGMRRGIENAENALDSAPEIGERYWFIEKESDDILSGKITEHIWSGDIFDRLRCIFGKLYRSREEALRAKLIMIKEKREKR